MLRLSTLLRLATLAGAVLYVRALRRENRAMRPVAVLPPPSPAPSRRIRQKQAGGKT